MFDLPIILKIKSIKKLMLDFEKIMEQKTDFQNQKSSLITDDRV